jgi:hypothetical protein
MPPTPAVHGSLQPLSHAGCHHPTLLLVLTLLHNTHTFCPLHTLTTDPARFGVVGHRRDAWQPSSGER